MTQFQFLIISDLHITVPPDPLNLGSLAAWMARSGNSRARLPPLKAVAKLAYDKRRELDAIVLCGDLADDGELENLESAITYRIFRTFRIDGFF